MSRIKKLTNKHLEEEYNELCESIEIIDCFSLSDLKLKMVLENEISKRNLIIKKTSSYKLVKEKQ